MFRALVLISAILLPTVACADPFQEVLTAAHAGDDEAVEAIIRTAETPRLQHNLLWFLGASHPDTVRFVRDWVKAEPENPVALTASAWSLYRTGFIERGDAPARYTWPASLDAARAMFREAFLLADEAILLEPDFLPASNAVMETGRVTGNQDRLIAELHRILAIKPNRESLIVAARSLFPHWGGSLPAVEGLCTRYAEVLPDAPGFTVEMCLVQATLESGFQGEVRHWARDRLVDYFDNPLFERHIIREAEKDGLPLELADRLRARLIAEDSLTVGVALSARGHILTMPDMPDLAATVEAMERDLSYALIAAERDPVNPETLRNLRDIYNLADLIRLQELGYYQVVQPADIEAKYYGHLDEMAVVKADLKARALNLLKATPRNTETLALVANMLAGHRPDPLEDARWRLSLGTNAIVYSNHYSIELAGYVGIWGSISSDIRYRISSGELPSYSQAALDEVLVCPYIRALRLLDQACSAEGRKLDKCFAETGMQRETAGASEGSPVVDAEKRGVCEAEREGPIESLWFEEVDLEL